MESIINPWVLYAISVISDFGVFMMIVLLLATAWLAVALDDAGFDSVKTFCKRKLFIITFCVSLVCSIFIPSQKTMLAMYFSTFITTDNINSGATAVTTLTTAIKTALGEDKNK